MVPFKDGNVGVYFVGNLQTQMEIPWFGAPLLEDGKFPMITLKKDITLTGSKQHG